MDEQIIQLIFIQILTDKLRHLRLTAFSIKQCVFVYASLFSHQIGQKWE